MKLKPIITLSALVLAMAGSSLARTWTSADGKNTFEGDFVSATDTEVVVKRSGRNIKFAISKLSADDQQFVKDSVAVAAAEAKALAESAKYKAGAVPKGISSKLQKLDGKSFKKAPLGEVVPKYYFLAYSASW